MWSYSISESHLPGAIDLSKSNSDIAAVLAQGSALEQSGRIAEARAAFQHVLERQRGNIEALTRLGLIEIAAQSPHAAVAFFEEAVKRRPRSPELRNNLAMVLLHLGRPDMAEPHAAQSLQLDKRSLETLKILFKCAYQLGRPTAARSYLEKALALRPGDPEFILDLAQAYDTSGEPDKARELYRRLIQSGHPSIYAYDGLARSQTYTAEPPEYGEIKRVLATKAMPPRDRQWLHRTLGKIDDDLGRYDEAWANFSALRSAERAAAHIATFGAQIERMKRIFTPEFFAARRDFGAESARPIFVFGMPRSGTTLVEQILSSHRQVHGANELMFFSGEINRLFPADRASDVFAQAVAALAREDAHASAANYLALLGAHAKDATHVVDKMPHNFERLWFLALLFPKARFIHCRRDPMATCVSCFTQPLGDAHAYTNELAALGKYYRLYYELMKFWRQVLPVEILDVDYEHLVRDQAAESRRLVGHVGLDWDDACLRFHETKRAVHTPSRRQVEEPIHTRAIEGWRRYEKHLAPLTAALGDLFKPSTH